MSHEDKGNEISSRARSQLRIQQRRQKSRLSLGLVTVGAVIIVTAFILAVSNPTPTRDHPMADGNAMGDPNAPVVMVDFSDYQCSLCLNFFQSKEAEIIEKYIATGKVYFIFRSFGDSPGGDSGRAAQASYCAGDQGKFWEMHDIIFTNFSNSDNGYYSIERLTKFAKKIDLNEDIFRECLITNKYSDRVDEDRSAAIEKGVTGTPTFFVNDQVIVGNLPLETFFETIDAEIAKAEE